MNDAKKLGAVIDPIEGGMPERLLADPDVQSSLASENARLRAELAAETKRADDNYHSLTKHWLNEGRIRAELAAARKEADGVAQQAADLCTKYLNERDAERKAKFTALDDFNQRMYQEIALRDNAIAERDALRAELAAAYETLKWYADQFCEYNDDEGCGKYEDVTCAGCRARARIDAALKGGE